MVDRNYYATSCSKYSIFFLVPISGKQWSFPPIPYTHHDFSLKIRLIGSRDCQCRFLKPLSPPGTTLLTSFCILFICIFFCFKIQPLNKLFESPVTRHPMTYGRMHQTTHYCVILQSTCIFHFAYVPPL